MSYDPGMNLWVFMQPRAGYSRPAEVDGGVGVGDNEDRGCRGGIGRREDRGSEWSMPGCRWVVRLSGPGGD